MSSPATEFGRLENKLGILFMELPSAELTVALSAYLCGSIPFGLVVARVAGGIDIRQHGSGNIGATNVGRVMGARWGLTVLLLDALKGLLPVWLIPWAAADLAIVGLSTLQVIAGISTVVGHMFPVWLKFRGGKGVATSLGVVLYLLPWGSLAGLLGFILCMLASRIVALSSIVAALMFAVGQLAIFWPNPFSTEKLPLSIFSLAVPALIIIQHRANIGRMLRGEEKKFEFGGKRKAAAAEGTQSADAASGKE